jgi:hypothetical protein
LNQWQAQLSANAVIRFEKRHHVGNEMRDEEYYTATHMANGGSHYTSIESASKGCAELYPIPEALIPIGVSEEVKMHQTVVLRQFF